jgi:hypothetical protein
VTNNDATVEFIKYNAARRGKLVTHLRCDQVSDREKKYAEVLAEMPCNLVDFSLLGVFNRPGVDLRIISDFEMLPNPLLAAVTFLKRPDIPLEAYFGANSKAA